MIIEDKLLWDNLSNTFINFQEQAKQERRVIWIGYDKTKLKIKLEGILEAEALKIRKGQLKSNIKLVAIVFANGDTRFV